MIFDTTYSWDFQNWNSCIFIQWWRREGQKASFYPHIHTLLGEIWAGALNVFFKQRWHSNLYIRYSLSHLWHMSSCIYLIFASNILWICIVHSVNVSQFKVTPWINLRCWYILFPQFLEHHLQEDIVFPWDISGTCMLPAICLSHHAC